MKELTLDIKPKQGLGELNFGDSSERLISFLGEAEELDDIEDADEFNTVILKYQDRGMYVFLEGVEKPVVSCFELHRNPAARLFNEEVFKLSEEEVIDLMNKHGFKELETGYEDDGNKRVSFEDGMIDFFFDKDEMKAINWGVLVNDQGDII